MKRTVVTTPDAPSSASYSQAIRAGSTIYVSGTIGTDPKTGKLAGPTIREQARQALANCRAVLEAAGASLDDVVDVGVLLARPQDFAEFNLEYALVFPAEPPARWVAKLGVEIPDLLVSIRMTAFAPEA